MGDVEVVAHGQTPHFSSDAGGDALPPQVSDATRCAPMGTVRGGSGASWGAGGQLQYSLLLTSCSNWARCPDSRSGRRCRCSLPAYSDPRAASSSSEPPSTLQSSVQTCETGRTDGRTDGQLPTKVRYLPLFLACATISSYCCLCFCASSAGFAGRLLQQRIKTTAYFDFLLHGDGPMGSGQRTPL